MVQALLCADDKIKGAFDLSLIYLYFRQPSPLRTCQDGVLQTTGYYGKFVRSKEYADYILCLAMYVCPRLSRKLLDDLVYLNLYYGKRVLKRAGFRLNCVSNTYIVFFGLNSGLQFKFKSIYCKLDHHYIIKLLSCDFCNTLQRK